MTLIFETINDEWCIFNSSYSKKKNIRHSVLSNTQLAARLWDMTEYPFLYKRVLNFQHQHCIMVDLFIEYPAST